MTHFCFQKNTFFLVLVCFVDEILLCSSGWPGPLSDYAGLEVTDMLLPQPNYWDYSMGYRTWLSIILQIK